MITGGFRSRKIMEKAIEEGEIDLVGLARPLCTQPDLPRRLIEKKADFADSYEDSLVLGTGFWGHNSPSSLIKGINSFGPVGFYYWQIIRLADGLTPQTDLGVLRAFFRHLSNDFKLAMRRKRHAH